jgi:hypothetical protein
MGALSSTLYSTLFQSAEVKGIFVFLSCVGSFIPAGFAHSLSLFLSPHGCLILEKAQHTRGSYFWK